MSSCRLMCSASHPSVGKTNMSSADPFNYNFTTTRTNKNVKSRCYIVRLYQINQSDFGIKPLPIVQKKWCARIIPFLVVLSCFYSIISCNLSHHRSSRQCAVVVRSVGKVVSTQFATSSCIKVTILYIPPPPTK